MINQSDPLQNIEDRREQHLFGGESSFTNASCENQGNLQSIDDDRNNAIHKEDEDKVKLILNTQPNEKEKKKNDLVSGTAFLDELRDEQLAVAVAITEEEEEEVFLPSASLEKERGPICQKCDFSYLVLMAIILLLAVAVGTALFVFKSKEEKPTESPTVFFQGDNIFLKNRNNRIRYQILRGIGNEMNASFDVFGQSALDWILNEDPQRLDPNSNNLVQRYICALFYLSTTKNQPWKSCNRPLLPEDTSNCTALKLIGTHPDVTYEKIIDRKRWLSDEHECKWNGVSCDDYERIRGIELRGQEIRGMIPTEMAKMPYLQSFNIIYNDMYGGLPSEFGSMENLVSIELDFNFFTGEIPMEWYKGSKQLERLTLGGNFLTGTIPTEIGLMEYLKGYNIFNNDFSGSIPTQIGLLRFLSYTWMERNLLTGTIPSEIGKLKRLQELWMYRNRFIGNLPSEMGMLDKLETLRLYMNSFDGSIPEEHYNMSRLKRWDLYDCNFTSTISTKIGQLQNLEVYRIRQNNFYGTIPTEIATIKGLKGLWFHFNQLTGDVPRDLCALRGDNGVGIQVLDVDCSESNDDPQIACIDECCTSCCDPVTKICLNTQN